MANQSLILSCNLGESIEASFCNILAIHKLSVSSNSLSIHRLQARFSPSKTCPNSAPFVEHMPKGLAKPSIQCLFSSRITPLAATTHPTVERLHPYLVLHQLAGGRPTQLLQYPSDTCRRVKILFIATVSSLHYLTLHCKTPSLNPRSGSKILLHMNFQGPQWIKPNSSFQSGIVEKELGLQ